MCNIEFLLKALGVIAVIVPGIWAVILYGQSIKSKKVDSLDKFWVDNLNPNYPYINLFEKLNTLALLLDTQSPEAKDARVVLENENSEAKLSFLSFLDRVAVYYKEEQVIKEDALYKFHWYFNYVYTNASTTEAFWKNIGGEQERKSFSWSVSRKMADDCAVYMKSNGIS